MFKMMYDDGLIYRGHRIINWDPKGQTTISDDEIIYKEEKTKFYYLKYGPFTIGTARPETKFGDKYVVMHPDDTRYADYKHGQKIELEWINGPITATVIKDESINMNFGTGVMTITPWHSAADFDIAERYKLDKEQIIDQFGRLLPVAGEFAGMKITEARPKIIEKLKSKGLLEKEEDYTHNIATAERSGGIIEPQIMNQWFVDVNKEFIIPHSNIKGIKSTSKTTLKELMRAAVANGQIKIIPDRFEKIYFQWIDNLHDWNISRQIWYGHRIPVWYRGDEIYVDIEPPKGDDWKQDEDTLDTWFSSGLWTFSTLGWPEKTETRLSLIIGTGPGNDSKLSEDKIRGYKNYANKIWNISRFVLENTKDFDPALGKDFDKHAPEFSWQHENIEEFKKILQEITDDIENFRFYLAGEKLYAYVWRTFADKIIEESKSTLKDGDEKTKLGNAIHAPQNSHHNSKALHPFMPFVTEEIWSMMLEKKNLLMVESWPV
jgi:valyl-tRNA synthetase